MRRMIRVNVPLPEMVDSASAPLVESIAYYEVPEEAVKIIQRAAKLGTYDALIRNKTAHMHLGIQKDVFNDYIGYLKGQYEDTSKE